MTSTMTDKDPVEILLETLLAGHRQAHFLTVNATTHHRQVMNRLKMIEPIRNKGAKEDYDFVNEVLFKLSTGRHSPACLTQKAEKFYKSVKKKLRTYEGALTEKRIAEVGTERETREERNTVEVVEVAEGKSESLLTFTSLTVTAKKIPIENTSKDDMPQTVDSDKRDLYKLFEANAKHISDNKKLKEALDTANNEIESLSARIQKQTERAAILKQNKQLREQLDELVKENRHLSGANQTMNRSVQSAQAEMNTRIGQVAAIQSELEETQDVKRRITEENWNLKKELGSVRDKVGNQSKQIMGLKAVRNADDDTAKGDLQTLQDKYTKLSNEHKELQKDLVSAKEEMENQSKSSFAQSNKKEREMMNTKKDLELMKEENTKLESDKTKLRRDVTTAKQHILEQSNQIEKLKKERKAVSTIKEQLQNQIDVTSKIDEENIKLKCQLMSTKNEMESQQTQILELTTTIDHLKQDDSGKRVIQKLTEENERLGSEITKLMLKLNEGEDDDDHQGPAENNESKPETDSSRALKRQRELNKNLSENNRKLEEEVNDLKSRFSALASHKLTADNPNIADLSDLYRPTNVSEQFRQVYDDEWTDAYAELEKENSENETTSIDTLATILKDIETFCMEVSSKQFDTLKSAIVTEMTYPKYHHKSGTVIAGKHRAEMSVLQTELTDKLLKDLRKSLGILSTGPLSQIFHQVHLSDNKHDDGLVSPKLNAFLVKALKLVWMMKMQTPPMGLLWAETQQTVDKKLFMLYTKTGEIIKQCVWPAVILHDGGPIMSKGIVQAF